jgi:hypothetical protein
MEMTRNGRLLDSGHDLAGIATRHVERVAPNATGHVIASDRPVVHAPTALEAAQREHLQDLASP